MNSIHCEHFNELALQQDIFSLLTWQFSTLEFIWFDRVICNWPCQKLCFEKNQSYCGEMNITICNIKHKSSILTIEIFIRSSDAQDNQILELLVKHLWLYFPDVDRGGIEDKSVKVDFYFGEQKLLNYTENLFIQLQKLLWRFCYTETLQSLASKQSLTLYLSAKLRFDENYCHASFIKLVDKYGLESTIKFVDYYSIEVHESVKRTLKILQDH